MPLTAFLALLLLISAGLLAIEGAKRLELRKSPSSSRAEMRERVLVMVPCRGRDITLRDNLLSLKSQDYGSFDLVAIVDSEEDESLPAIREAGLRYIISEAECRKCSGKVRAITSAISANGGYGTYVIADSDATFAQGWLRTLLAPLSDPGIGISTAFPVFIPVAGLWSTVKMVWGFVGNGMMESSVTRFGWGGSLAFRSSLLDNGNFGIFSESVSDDTALTRFASNAHLKIAYCDGLLVTVKSLETLSSFIEWSNRQTALAIRGNGKLFGLGLAYFGARLFLLASSILLAVMLTPLALLLLMPYAVGVAKIYGRSGSRNPLITPVFLSMDVLYLANLLKGKRMQSIFWRGKEYTLHTDGL